MAGCLYEGERARAQRVLHSSKRFWDQHIAVRRWTQAREQQNGDAGIERAEL